MTSKPQTSKPHSTYTPQQEAAIRMREVSVALAAGAGCGKTFVLTQRYLEELEPGRSEADLSALVAITFTERAAREMRARIRGTCRERLRTCAPEDVEHWQKLVRQVDAARISTIHSFCAGLLRANAAEAGLDPQFAVLDQVTVGPLKHQVAQQTIREGLEERDESTFKLVQEFGLEPTIEISEKLVGLRFQMNFESWKDKSPEELKAHWLTVREKLFVPAILETFRDGDGFSQLKQILNTHSPSKGAMLDRWGALNAGLERLEAGDSSLEVLKILREQAKVQGGAKSFDSTEIYEEVRDVFKDFRDGIDKLLGLLPYNETHLQLAAEMSHAALHLADRSIRNYTQEKKRAGVVDFDDLLILTRDLLRDHPEVRKKTAAGIRFLMVDEFQDTDPTQAEIVRSLLGKDLARGKLFLVGDAQQSIYRFRRADPRVFATLRQEIPEPGRLPLSCNFRSQPAILNFVNALFVPLEGEPFQALEPFDPAQYSPEPSIEFLFSSNPDDDSADGRRTEEGRWIARRIRELLHDQTPRIREPGPKGQAPKLRRVELRDIVILFRAMTDVRHYEAALRDEGLDYYLAGGRAFYAQQEVYDVTNLCRFLYNPADGVSLLGILRSPFFNLSDDVIFAVWRHHSDILKGLFSPPPVELSENQQSDVRRAGRILHQLISDRDRLGLYDLLRHALDLTGYDAALLSEFLGERKLANLQKLLEMAREFDQIGTYGLPEFVDRLQAAVVEELKEEMAATHAEGSDVIRLMTIHQSKGLEFPVVILADMDRVEPPGRSDVAFEPELGMMLRLREHRGDKREHLALKMHNFLESREDQAEMLRLLYVAVTRAADHLILSAGLKGNGKLQSSWLKALDERFDLQTGLAKFDPNSGASIIPSTFLEKLPHILVHGKIPAEIPHTREKVRALPLREFEETAATAPPETWPLPDFTQQFRFHSRKLSVSELEDLWLGQNPTPLPDRSLAEIRTEDENISAEDLGTLVHAVLERLDFSHPEAMTSALQILRSSSRITLSDEQQRTAARLLERLINSPVRQELANARQSYRELEFQLRWELQGDPHPWSISGTIDNLIENADGEWVILDYKTGRLAAQDENWLRTHYSLQMGLYALAVERILGKRPQHLRLLHLRRESPVVEYTLNDKFLQEIRTQIDAILENLSPTPQPL